MRSDALAILSSLCALALAATFGLPLTASGAGEPSWSQEELGKAARAEQEIDPGVQEAIDRGDLKTLRVLLKKLNYYKDEPQIKVYAFQVAVSLGNVAVVEYLAGLGWLDECRKPNPAGCSCCRAGRPTRNLSSFFARKALTKGRRMEARLRRLNLRKTVAGGRSSNTSNPVSARRNDGGCPVRVSSARSASM